MRNLLRRAEHGSAEGGTFGDIAFIPLLTGLLMVGVFFALLGFWRVGASFATQRSAETGAVASGQGGASLASYWSWWGGANPTGGGFVVTPRDRSVRSNVSTSFTFDYLGFGPWTLPINGQTQSRLERFYPGAPICVGQICGE